MVAASDKAPSDPALRAPDLSDHPTPPVVIAEQPPDVTGAKAARVGEAETVQAPAAPDIAIVFGPVSAGGEPPVELGDAAVNRQPGMVAASDKAPSDPSLAASDPSDQPSPPVGIAEQPSDVTAAKAAWAGEAETAQAHASPDIAMVFGPVSAGGEPPVELGDAAVNPQPGMVAANDKAPSDPALGPPDPSAQPNPPAAIAEQPPDVTLAKAVRSDEAGTVQVPAAPGIAIVFGPVSAGGEPPVEPGDAAVNPQPGMVAASDKAPPDPALAALDPCGQSILVGIAGQPPDVTAPKAVRAGDAETVQAPAAPDIAIVFGPVSAGGEHPVRLGEAAANPQLGIAPDPCGQPILVEISERPPDVTAPKPKRLGDADTAQALASLDIAIASGRALAGGEPPIKPGEATANPPSGMVAAGDKAPSDPALGASDPSGQPDPPAGIAERPLDVTAAKPVRFDDPGTVQALAAPDIVMVFGPVSAGGKPPVEPGDAPANPQPSAQASVDAGRNAGAMAAPTQATPPPQSAASTRSAASPPDARDLIESLLRRGDELLKIGDIAAARLLYERAAKAGSARAAMLAGKTYDPLYFVEIGARGIAADRSKAIDWYSKAAGLGDREAGARLEKLRAKAQQ
jgi:hypothetical protein